MSLLDNLLGIKTLLVSGVEQVARQRWNLIGATAADNPAEDRLDISIGGIVPATPSTIVLRGTGGEVTATEVLLSPTANGATLEVATLPSASVTTTNSVSEAGDTGNKWSAWSLTGVYDASQGTQLLYWVGDVNAGAARMRLYSDVAHTLLVAHGQLGDDLGGTITLTQDNASGLSGTVVAAAGVGTDNDAANVLTCSSAAVLAPYTIPDGYMATIVIGIRGVCTSGDKSVSYYFLDNVVRGVHVGASVGLDSGGVPTNGIAGSSSNIADVQGVVSATIAAGGAVAVVLDGRANNTIKWRWFVKSIDIAPAT